MSFPALSQLSGLIPNSSHQNLNVLPSHIQMPLLGHPASTMAYVPQHPEIIPPSSLNLSPSPNHSPRSSPLHLHGQNINNLLVGGRHKSSSRTPSPNTLSPSPLTDFPRIPHSSTQQYHQTMMLDATSPILTSPSLLAPERHYINRSPNTTSPQQRVSPSVPQMRSNYSQQIDLRQLQHTPNPNISISPYHTPIGSPQNENLLTQQI